MEILETRSGCMGTPYPIQAAAAAAGPAALQVLGSTHPATSKQTSELYL